MLSSSFFLEVLEDRDTTFLFFFLAMLRGMWVLSFWTRIEPLPPPVES